MRTVTGRISEPGRRAVFVVPNHARIRASNGFLATAAVPEARSAMQPLHSLRKPGKLLFKHQSPALSRRGQVDAGRACAALIHTYMAQGWPRLFAIGFASASVMAAMIWFTGMEPVEKQLLARLAGSGWRKISGRK